MCATTGMPARTIAAMRGATLTPPSSFTLLAPAFTSATAEATASASLAFVTTER